MNKLQPPQESPTANLLFNIILPVVILEQLGKRLGPDGPTWALIVALALPTGYGLYDWWKRRHKNWFSVLGVVNVLFTGGLALFKLEGFWFAVKEAAFPLILGIGVFASTFTRRPFLKTLALNPNVLNLGLIEDRLTSKGMMAQFDQHIKKSNLLLTASFLVSATLNFVLARWIFAELPTGLSDAEHSALLNEQIAKMTWMSFLVIVLPLMVFMMGILWYLIGGIRRLTGLQVQEIMVQK